MCKNNVKEKVNVIQHLAPSDLLIIPPGMTWDAVDKQIGEIIGMLDKKAAAASVAARKAKKRKNLSSYRMHSAAARAYKFASYELFYSWLPF